VTKKSGLPLAAVQKPVATLAGDSGWINLLLLLLLLLILKKDSDA
jgi:hypothetical protein